MQIALRTSFLRMYPCIPVEQCVTRQCCLFKVRDITTKPEWWDAYSLTIPVLTVAREDGSEVVALLAQARSITANTFDQQLHGRHCCKQHTSQHAAAQCLQLRLSCIRIC